MRREEHVRTQRSSQVTTDLWALRMKFAPHGAQNLEVAPGVHCSDMSGKGADIERNSDDDDDHDDHNDDDDNLCFPKFFSF